MKSREWNIIFAAALVVISACSPKTSHRVLSFLFDGVPDSLVSNPYEAMADTAVLGDSTISPVAFPQNKEADYHLHEPYSRQECTSCHDKASRSTILKPQPDLCYQCHADYSDNNAFLHGPAAGGYCTSCHEPHMSKLPHLLKRTGKELCGNCHSLSRLATIPAHQLARGDDCLSCHDPHGSNKRFILR